MKTFYQTLGVIIVALAIMIFGDSCNSNSRSGQRTRENIGVSPNTQVLTDSVLFRAKQVFFDSSMITQSIYVELIKVPYGYHPTDTIYISSDHSIRGKTYRLLERVSTK